MQIKHLCKSFEGLVVLDRFSLTLPARGVVALMGPSGSGKTTLVHILAGLEPADSGQIVSDKQKLSMVFQEDRLLDGVSARGNILAVLERGRESEALANTWLARMGLEAAGHLLPRELSGGMRRRLALARAMAYGGDLMILDEPFAGLDEATRAEIYPYLFDRQEHPDRLTILVTHDREEAERLADQLIVMTGPPLSTETT
ncbi:MAG: ATP-binding cassette domain-containing protein [Oscillospiraceae bacterium]|nr:ATP-binding cassette domain-containing protein [Oscillospiraceae bacterium]